MPGPTNDRALFLKYYFRHETALPKNPDLVTLCAETGDTDFLRFSKRNLFKI